mgnify:CR=1 FL=1
MILMDSQRKIQNLSHGSVTFHFTITGSENLQYHYLNPDELIQRYQTIVLYMYATSGYYVAQRIQYAVKGV